MGLFQRDKLFSSRWKFIGGSGGSPAGKIRSCNMGERGSAFIVCHGHGLPLEAKYYTFRNGGVIYTCPVEEIVLDLFIIPDIGDINGIPILLDRELRVLDKREQGMVDNSWDLE